MYTERMEKITLKKADTRGGKRFKKYTQKPEALLIGALWIKLGGVKAVSDKLNIPYQSLINFRMRGRVPLEQVFNIANILEIEPWGLNYKQLRVMYPNVPEWKQLVKAYALPEDVTNRILKLKTTWA